MEITIRDVLDRLAVEGLLGADVSPAARSALAGAADDELPWYLRTAVGIGAWLASLLLIGFVYQLSGLRGFEARIVFGLILVAAAVAARRSAHAEFVRQGAIAASFAGQGVILFALAQGSTTSAGIAGLLLSSALIWLVPDRLHRFLSTLVGATSALVAVASVERGTGFELVTLALVALAADVWRGGIRQRDDHTIEVLRPVGYGLVVALFGVLAFSGMFAAGGLWRDLGTIDETPALGALTTIGVTAALAALALAVLREHGTPRRSGLTFAVLAGVIALGLGALSSPGIVAGAAVLVLAFDRRNRVLMGLGVGFLVAFGSLYYYSLDLTLLEKSVVLAGTGLLFLLIRTRLDPDRVVAGGET